MLSDATVHVHTHLVIQQVSAQILCVTVTINISSLNLVTLFITLQQSNILPEMSLSFGLWIIVFWLAGCFCEPSGNTDANLGFVFQKPLLAPKNIFVSLKPSE